MRIEGVDACLTVSKGSSSSRCWTYSGYCDGRHWGRKSDFLRSHDYHLYSPTHIL